MTSAPAPRRPFNRPAIVALLALALAFLWQALTVRYNHGGNWTGLFHAGSLWQPPSALAFENIPKPPDSPGYDGQFYHYLAHDPFLSRGFSSAMDSPRVRARRILLPLAAWTLAGAGDRWIDPAYFSLTLLAVFLGVFWTSLAVRDRGAHPAWGAAFLLLPASIASLDRMTVDVALAAFTAGVVVYAPRARWAAVWTLCALAGLTRETGLLLPAALCGWLCYGRRFRLAACLAASAAPAFAWFVWVAAHTPPNPMAFISPVPFAGWLARLAVAPSYTYGGYVAVLAVALDYAALASVPATALYCLLRRRDLPARPEGWIALAFLTLAAAISGQTVWSEAYAFARVLSPMLLAAALDGVQARSSLGLLPLSLAFPRMALQLVSPALRIVRGVLSV